MSKNPLLNGAAASLYIFLIVGIISYGENMIDDQFSILAPVAMISLFTFSAAVMGYLFCLQPLQLYFEGKKKSAVRLFLQTLGVFGAITLMIFILLFLGIF